MRLRRTQRPRERRLRGLSGTPLGLVMVVVGLVIAGGTYLLGSGWADLGTTMGIYGVVLAAFIFAWSGLQNQRLKREEAELVSVLGFIGNLTKATHKELALEGALRDALAQKLDLPGDELDEITRLVIAPRKTRSGDRYVFLENGDVWRVGHAGRGGGHKAAFVISLGPSAVDP